MQLIALSAFIWASNVTIKYFCLLHHEHELYFVLELCPAQTLPQCWACHPPMPEAACNETGHWETCYQPHVNIHTHTQSCYQPHVNIHTHSHVINHM